MPVRTIDFDNETDVAKHDAIVERQKQLIALGDKIIKSAGNRRRIIPLQRLFSSLKDEQNLAIRDLYGLTEEEDGMIPIIKEIYAAD